MVGKWTPFKDLFGCIEQFVAHEKPDVLLKTKSLLTCYKSEFLSLLLNSVRVLKLFYLKLNESIINI